MITSPDTNSWSPRSTIAFQSARDSSPTLSRLTIAWMRLPSPAWSAAKQSLPVFRRCTMRPASPTVSPVAVSVGRSAYRALTAATVSVTGTATG